MLVSLSVPPGYWTSEERSPWEQTAWPLQMLSVLREGAGPPDCILSRAVLSTPSALYNGTLYNIAKQVVFLKTASEHFFGLNLGMKQMDF